MKNIQLDPEDLLVTIDVSSLYTNIPHNEGIAAINRMMGGNRHWHSIKNVCFQFSLPSTYKKTSLTSMDNCMNKPKEQQWEPEWHQIMQ